MNKIGIIGAMAVEVDSLCKKIENSQCTKIAGLSFYSGLLNGTNVVIVQSGIGKVNAAMCATLLITQFKITHLINTGVAGGLDKRLSIFDMVASSDAIQHDFDTTEFGYPICQIPGLDVLSFEADKNLVELAQKAFEKANFGKKMLVGRIASGDIFVNSSSLKEKIIKNCNPACVEMEGAAIAQVSYLNKVPYLVLRCISDMAENTEEVYHEEKAAEISGFVVENMLALMAK